MRAIILAAGEGTRLRPLTSDRPKCLVELLGRPLLQYQLDALSRAGVDETYIVTGYRGDQIEAFGRPTRHNPEYATTNMVASLVCAADLLDGVADVLVCYSDIVYEPRIVEAIVDCPAATSITVDRQWRQLWELRFDDPLSDAETLKLSPDGSVIEVGKTATSEDEIEGQFMGLIKVSAATAPTLVEFYNSLAEQGPFDGRTRANMFMTSFLQLMIDSGQSLASVPVDGGWLEVDSLTDLRLYERLHRDGQLPHFWRDVMQDRKAS